MKVAEKDAIMEAFRPGEIDVLTATTVIEVGVDVPNASVMMVLNAERFGLAQLHQLRGRGRAGSPHVVLFAAYPAQVRSDRSNPTRGRRRLDQARRRIRVLLEQADGFAIAEQDLQLRGPGEFYGTRQHGLPELRIARVGAGPVAGAGGSSGGGFGADRARSRSAGAGRRGAARTCGGVESEDRGGVGLTKRRGGGNGRGGELKVES